MGIDGCGIHQTHCTCRGGISDPPVGEIRSNRKYVESNDKILVISLWALSDVSDEGNARIQEVMDTGITKDLVEIIKERKVGPAATLHTLGNLVVGNKKQTQGVIDASILDVAIYMLASIKV